MTSTLMNTYARLPVAFTKGEGCTLWDNEGKSYLDALSGIAVCNLGHSHPAITQAICTQAATLIHTSNLFGIPTQERLGDLLCQHSGMDRVFFANSGAEANEAAIKLARLHGHAKGIDIPTIIVMEQSFHGRTLATLTATGNRKVHAGFEPLVQGFVRVPYNDLEAIRQVGRHHHNIVAILVEPIQGEGGVNIPASDYLSGVRTICDEHNWLMMLDEIQTGMGRTGTLFAFQHSEIHPDVMTLAKGLGNGMPIGACLARGGAAELFHPGHHGTTFGGNLLACAAATAVLETMVNETIPQRAKELGELCLSALKLALDTVPGVIDIRGQGMIIGIELDRSCGELVRQALEMGLIINVTANSVIRLLPPLIMTRDEMQTLVNILAQLITHFLQTPAQQQGH